ncbi:hypothetical protein H6B10_17755, partial [Gemmiger formicilis]|nr:hypothetical protein [Gemmiger formicilis]
MIAVELADIVERPGLIHAVPHRLKQIVVDQVESMETTLAHLLPEMTSNLLAPVCVLVYL